MLRMLSDRIAVIPVEDPDQIGHIIIPKEAKRRSDQGIIKYRGDKVDELRIGDHVIFPAYVGNRVQVEDEGELVVMKEDDVIALMTEEYSRILYTREQVEQLLVNSLIECQTIVSADTFDEITERFAAQFDSFETVRVD